MAIKVYPLALCVVLMGCSVGPDFVLPLTQAPSTFIRNSGNQTGEHQDSLIVENISPDVQWWKSLKDPMLDTLVERAAAENLDVRAATERIEQSRAQRGVTASEFYPQLNGDGSYTRQKLSDKGVISLVSGGGSGGTSPAGGIPNPESSPPFNIYQYGFDLSWELDIWGRVRRGVEGADATVQASEEAQRALLVSTIAELVRDYVQLRGTQASIAITREDVEVYQHLVALTQKRADAGLSSEIDVANASAQEASVESQLPSLNQQEAMLMNAIALLLAEAPGALESELAAAQPVPPLPVIVPVGVPSELVKRRPDVLQAAAQLHAATADIGVAEADFFPKVTLTGNGMLQSLELSDLSTWAARSYSLGPSISLPIFEGGRLKSTLELRNAAQREAALQYRKSVLTAFHEVDNALTAFRSEQTRQKSLQKAVEQNRKALDLATKRYQQGLGDYLTVLTDNENLLNAETQRIQSTQTADVNMAQLYKALGGGWESDFPEKPKAE